MTSPASTAGSDATDPTSPQGDGGSGGDADPHVRFMRLALDQARAAAQLGEVPVGAVVVIDGKVVASAHNRRELDADPTAHAELLAIRQAAEALGDWRLEGATVYVTLEPCAMCAGAMVLSRIAHCVYGCTDPKGGFLGTLGDLSQQPGLNHTYAVTGQVLADPCADVLRGFFQELRQEQRRRRRAAKDGPPADPEPTSS